MSGNSKGDKEDLDSGNSAGRLRREIKLGGAIMLGLGSIVGTGVFVSLGIAAGVAGANVLPAIFLASLLAICNGLSSAQLAALHPVSGGTYEYGYKWISPEAGFTAGWLFLCAKSASAATAALGLAGYLKIFVCDFAGDFAGGFASDVPVVAIASGILVLLTIVVVVGIKRTSMINMLVVGATLIALLVFVVAAAMNTQANVNENLTGLLDFSGEDGGGWLTATALMFVAYTGYGRIATMGEEVADPTRTIPRAMILTLVVTMALYLCVGLAALATVGADQLAQSTKETAAPLLFVAGQLNSPLTVALLSVGAVTAMLGVMLNLLLGLSRVVLAMARRNDMPEGFSQINSRGVPLRATLLVAAIICGLIMIGDVKFSWSFSAFMVLIYYSITNLCALQVEREKRLYPAWVSGCGFAGCVSLTMFIDMKVGAVGALVVSAGFFCRWLLKKANRKIDESK